MYEVFVNDHPIYLTNSIDKETSGKYFLLETFDVEDVVNQLNNGVIDKAYLYHPDEEKLLKKFKERVPVVVAGGGLVVNQDQKRLLIFRNGKWDIPKGKLDKGESIEEASIREVIEETGVEDLTLDKFLCNNYNLFKRNGFYKLKETYWYAMITGFDGKLKPQKNEGILKAEWQDASEVKKSLQNSYPNIKIVIKEHEGLLQNSIDRIS